MSIRTVVHAGAYRDSIELMRMTLEIEASPGVQEASVMMGTPPNLQLLEHAGLLVGDASTAGPHDLVIAISAESDSALDAALDMAESLLHSWQLSSGSTSVELRPRSVVNAAALHPNASLMLISTPGQYAGAEAMKGLLQGLNVFMFSDNVPIEQEIALKALANQRGLIVMGPDCGTAILGGVPLGFANVVRVGSIGLVGPSGTGIQEVSCLIDRLGSGVSHAIGTGSHDLSDEVGSVGAIHALRELDADPETNVIVVVAKPSSLTQVKRILELAESMHTPIVACFLGVDPADLHSRSVSFAHNLEEAARLAVAIDSSSDVPRLAEPARSESRRIAGAIRGLFSGGTLCAEASMVLAELGLAVESNISLPGLLPLSLNAEQRVHRCLDLGADEYTVGRPHPMIDSRTRLDMILDAAEDHSTAVILLDIVLGHGSNPDPASELVPAIERAQVVASQSGRNLVFIASVCGTETDPQVRSRQVSALETAGVLVAESNVAAARLAGAVVGAETTSKRLDRPPVRRSTSGEDSGDEANGLLLRPEHVISVGLDSFDGALVRAGVGVSRVDWRPPGSGDPNVAWALACISPSGGKLDNAGARIDKANEDAVGRLTGARPVLVDLMPARDVWPQAGKRLLHAGPPIAWERMCGPMRGAMIGATLFERWAADADEAQRLLERGEIQLEPCHHAGAVGPMAGVISPSMSLWVVKNEGGGNVAYSNLNEGLGSVLRFGAYGTEVIDRLRWLEAVLAPTIRKAIAGAPGGIDLESLLAQALQMGDDGHNRNVAATSLFFRAITGLVLECESDVTRAAATLRFIDSNNHFFLNLSMAAAKVGLDAAHGVAHSSMVTAMARNGVDFGVRVSGLGDAWFTAPATVPEGLFFPGYSLADANPDMGDSAITETAGVGGFVMATAPALVQFVGGSAEDAAGYTREMMEITLTRNSSYSLPALGFMGAPTGIDVRRVVDTGILPVINSGIAHRQPGIGQVGAGIVRAPMACFEAAVLQLATREGAVT